MTREMNANGLSGPVLQASLPHLSWMAPQTARLPGVQPVAPGDWLRVDEAHAGQMALRDRLIATRPDDVHALLPSAFGAAQELLEQVVEECRSLPGYVVGDTGVRRPDGVSVPIDMQAPLMTLGRLVQEDFCIMQAAPPSDAADAADIGGGTFGTAVPGTQGRPRDDRTAGGRQADEPAGHGVHGGPGLHDAMAAGRVNIGAADQARIRNSDVAGEHLLAGAILCFPASWTLAEKLGRPLTGIHVPVPSYDAGIARRVQRLFDAIRPGQPLWRQNAMIYSDPALFHPRTEAQPRENDHAGGRYLRSERQCLVRLARSDAVVFSIHTHVMALERLPQTAVAALIARMTEK